MIPIAHGTTAGSEKGVAAILDLIINPKRALDAKAALDELIRVRDEADEALSKANAQHAENMKRAKELDSQEQALAAAKRAFDDAALALSKAEAKYARELSQFNTESAYTNSELSARAVAVASAEQAVASERAALQARETALGPKELAAAALKTEYERKLAELKKLTGQL